MFLFDRKISLDAYFKMASRKAICTKTDVKNKGEKEKSSEKQSTWTDQFLRLSSHHSMVLISSLLVFLPFDEIGKRKG